MGEEPITKEKLGSLDTKGFRQKLKSIASLNNNSLSQKTSLNVHQNVGQNLRPLSLEIPTNTVTLATRPPTSKLKIFKRSQSGSRNRSSTLEAEESASSRNGEKSEHSRTTTSSRPRSLDKKACRTGISRERRIQRAQTCRMYFLGRKGPCCFIVLGEDTKTKFVVTIDEQPSCSCNNTLCVHLLFVFIRVLKLKETDSRIFASRLRQYEVDSVINQYDTQHSKLKKEKQSKSDKFTPCGNRQLQIWKQFTNKERSKSHTNLFLESSNQNLCMAKSSVSSSNECLHKKNRSMPDSNATTPNWSRETTMSQQSLDSDEDNYSQCPICLFSMYKDESLVDCQNGCRNKIHSQCLQIWENACRIRDESFTCPLCRAPFSTQDFPTRNTSPTLSDSSSPDEEDSPSHQTIKHLLQPIAKEIGPDIIDGMMSNDLEIFQLALTALLKWNTTQTTSSHIQSVSLIILKCIFEKNITIWSYCTDSYLSLFPDSDDSKAEMGVSIEPIIRKIIESYLTESDSIHSNFKDNFVQLLQTKKPVWVHYFTIISWETQQLLKLNSEESVKKSEVLRELFTSLQLEKVIDTLDCQQWNHITESSIYPLIKAYPKIVHKKLRQCIKEVISIVCRHISTRPDKFEQFWSGMKKKEITKGRVFEYIEKMLSNEKLKQRLASQSSRTNSNNTLDEKSKLEKDCTEKESDGKSGFMLYQNECCKDGINFETN